MTSRTETRSDWATSKKLGVSALVACAAGCSASLLAAAGGSGVLAGLATRLRPGSEWLVGGMAFALSLCFFTLQQRWRERRRRAHARKPASGLA
jgi:hypothetical protein